MFVQQVDGKWDEKVTKASKCELWLYREAWGPPTPPGRVCGSRWVKEPRQAGTHTPAGTSESGWVVRAKAGERTEQFCKVSL